MTIYRGQRFGGEEIAFIRQFIRDHPELSRWKLSRQLCEAWQWKQANGALRDMVCRGLLLVLDRAGEIQLPPVRRAVRNRLAERERPEPVIPDNRPVCGPLDSITPLEFVQVRRTPEEPLFNSLMEQYHYLGYEQPVGEHLKYLVKANGQAIACLAWQSAPRHLKVRDRYIGWSDEARERNVHLLAYNTRFLILPWVRVEHLASHILGRMAKLVPQDWQRLYAHPIYWLETFVDTSRFRGTCYRAANWQVIGTTAGRGHRAPTFEQTRPAKQMLGLPLIASSGSCLQDETPAIGGESGRAGPDHRARHAGAVERVGKRKAQERAACAGRDAGEATHDRKDQERFGAAGNARA